MANKKKSLKGLSKKKIQFRKKRRLIAKKNFSRYRSFQKTLSKWKKDRNVKISENFSSLTSKLYKQIPSSDDIKEIGFQSIDDLYEDYLGEIFEEETGFEEELDSQSLEDLFPDPIPFWQLGDEVIKLDPETDIEIINDSIQLENFKGKVKDFIGVSWGLMLQKINATLKSTYKKQSDRSGIAYFPKLKNGYIVFDLKVETIVKPKEVTEIPAPIKVTEKESKKEKPSEDLESKKIEKEIIELRANKAIELSKAGFTPEQIMKILGL